MWFNISPAKGCLPKEESAKNIKEQNGRVYENGVKSNKIELNSGSPVMRYKHAVCSSSSGHIYIHGGRFGNLPLDDDVWRFDPHQNNWIQLRTIGCRPPNLQEHTLVEYNDQLYLFGGQVSASNNEQSFWRLDLANCEWHSLSVKSSKFGAHLRPTNRRGHSAVIYSNSMYIYGGFEDFRGSSNELWEYQLANQRWELRNLSSSSACHPEPRHSHSSIVYGNSMYVYGGLSNLKPLGDLWRWSWPEKRWFKEKTRGSSPGQLHGHTAIEAFGSMFVFGGERKGRATRSLWRLNLSNMSWQKIRPKGPQPNPTTWHGAISNPLGILDEANYIVQGDPELLLKSSQENCNVSSSNGSLRLQQNSRQAATVGQQQQTTTFQQAKSRPANKSGSSTASKPFLQTILPIKPSRQLTHSKSSSSGMAAIVEKRPIAATNAHLHERCSKRKSRLSFLRGRSKHNERASRSTYELKQLNYINANKSDPIRHSISVAPSNQTTAIISTRASLKSGEEVLVCDLGTTNPNGILDNLDTDIKEMFQQALDSNESQPNHRKRGEQVKQEDLNGDISMSVDTQTATSRSQYETARQTNVDSLNDIAMRASQRTSYAYTTPPSELNTLRSGDSSVTLQSGLFQTSQTSTTGNRQRDEASDLLRAGARQDQRGGRRDRPKSEIVQSLIDRADARIKHLYKPYFNQQLNNPEKQQQYQQQQQQLQQRLNCLDKSKRHTIHQTMTYYNLYFAEDNKSTNVAQTDEMVSPQIFRDDISSSTIKGSERRLLPSSSTNGAVIGVHMDQDSQFSFELPSNSSQSGERTLCANKSSNLNLPDPSDVTFAHYSGSGGAAATASSVQNALTGQRDAEISCDNTSLSFSAIAEFEEDDMLQCSSNNPAGLMDSSTSSSSNNSNSNGSSNSNSNSNSTSSNKAENGSATSPTPRPAINMVVQRGDLPAAPQKSTSSGYDSISGYEQRVQDKSGSSSSNHHTHDYQGQHLRQQQEVTNDNFCSPASQYQQVTASNSDTQEEGSVRTESSSMGNFTASETSPEQSIVRRSKRKNRYWQLCMFVIGGKQGGSNSINEPITIWRLYI